MVVVKKDIADAGRYARVFLYNEAVQIGKGKIEKF